MLLTVPIVLPLNIFVFLLDSDLVSNLVQRSFSLFNKDSVFSINLVYYVVSK